MTTIKRRRPAADDADTPRDPWADTGRDDDDWKEQSGLGGRHHDGGPRVPDRVERRSNRARHDNDDDLPRERGRRDRTKEDRPNLSRGGGWDQRGASRAFRQGALEVKDKAKLVKFLEDSPFANYDQHWVKVNGSSRAYTCLLDNCPLCDLGYETRSVSLFNVLDLKDATNYYWETGPEAFKAVKKLTENERTSPINRDDLYFEVSRYKKDNGFYAFDVDPIKARDLVDDFNIEPLDSDELDQAMKGRFDDSVIPYHSRRDLKDVADELDDD